MEYDSHYRAFRQYARLRNQLKGSHTDVIEKIMLRRRMKNLADFCIIRPNQESRRKIE
ncbi:MAG: hypothetical protein H0Z38_04155 [Firmicutes bacterium]|nr:hypothetical protein [Bacillota bacterium]